MLPPVFFILTRRARSGAFRRESGFRPRKGGRSDVTRYAAVFILDNPFCIDNSYHYYVPAALEDSVVRGAFVTVPFGRGNRKQLALVTDVCGEAGLASLPAPIDPARIKPISGVCRERLFLTEEQLALCFFLREQTLCTVGEAVRTIVPAQALATLVEFFRPAAKAETSDLSGLDASQLMILEYVRARGSVSMQTLKTRFGAGVPAALDRLAERSLIERELTVHQTQTPTEIWYTLACPASDAEASLRGDKGAVRLTSKTHKAVVDCVLHAEGRLSAADLKQKTGADPVQLRALVSKGLLRAETEEVYRAPEGAVGRGQRTPFELSEEQAAAVATLSALGECGQPRAALLHGVTGSGKTCVILETIDRTLDRGRGVIVLLPEISLTPQMLSIFLARYGTRVAVIHSGLSATERMDSHRRIQAGEATLVIGTRSAVFAPVKDLGLIVMDEEQEHTYKSDMNPKYHARDVARFRCAHANALLLLASATPSLESYQKAREGKYTLVTMKSRYGAAKLPRVDIVDMRGEPQAGNVTPLGQVLRGELMRVKEEGNQSVLFINRRGYSTQVVCRSCGKAVSCPHCSVAMNYHTKRGTYSEGELICHWCGTRRKYPETCPDCGSPHLVRMGYGTQRIEQELESAVPGARVMRMDADTTGTKAAYDRLLGGFRRHEADVLLGTQMVTKGHDFPDVTLVGVLLADMSLYLDDYRASERTFSLLTQVIGRAGRADKPGLAIIQTMNPDSDVIKKACAQDYEAFFNAEIRLRRLLVFPPFCDIVLLTLSSPDEKELQKGCLRLAEELNAKSGADYRDVPLQSFGPFEAPVYRVDNVYRMRMVIKCRLNKRARALFAELLASFSPGSRREPILSIDFNPTSL